jgi:hypothetical protein
MVHVPSWQKTIEQISFEAEREYIMWGKCRMSITAYENLLVRQNVALRTGVDKTTLRLSDFMDFHPLQVK